MNQESAIDTSVDPKKTEIIVNTRPKFVDQEYLTYEEIVHLAYQNPPTGPDIEITVSYVDGPRNKPEGMLAKGQRVKVVEKMVFHVKVTDKS